MLRYRLRKWLVSGASVATYHTPVREIVMGIEVHNGRFYLYHRRRIRGQLRGRYVCALTPAAAAEYRERVLAERQRLQEHRRLAADFFKQCAALNAAAAEFDTRADRAFRAAMSLAGFYLHKRHEWRRRKEFPSMNALVPPALPLPRSSVPAVIKPLSSDPAVQAIFDRAAAGDLAVLPAVRTLLADPRFQKEFGDLASIARDHLVYVVAGDNLVVGEAVRQQADAMVQSLLADSGPTPTFTERLAALRVANNWIAVHAIEVLVANRSVESPLAEALHRQLAQAERRLEGSMRCLAVLRRLKVPEIIAQVNVAAGSMMVNNAPFGAAPSLQVPGTGDSP